MTTIRIMKEHERTRVAALVQDTMHNRYGSDAYALPELVFVAEDDCGALTLDLRLQVGQARHLAVADFLGHALHRAIAGEFGQALGTRARASHNRRIAMDPHLEI